jgi:Tfp pilus assembly protein PilF
VSVAVGSLTALILQTTLLLAGSKPALAEDHTYRPEVMARMLAGIRLLRERKCPAARVEFEEVVKEQPELPDVYNNIALSYAYEGNNAKAEIWYRKALDIEPIYGQALNNYGILPSSMHKPAEAIKLFNRCMEVMPGNQPDLYFYVGNAQRELGHRSEARKSYIQAIKLKPDSAKAYSGLAAIDLDDNRIDDAYDELKKALQLSPNSAFIYYHLGLIEEKRGHRDAAVAAYSSSLKYETNKKYSAETKNRIARLKSGSSGGPFAFGDLLAGGNSDEVRSRAHQALVKHDWTDARKDLNTLVHGAAAEDPIAWNNYGLALAGDGQHGEALDAYRKAVQLNSGGFPEAQYNLGMVLRHMGDNRGAEQAFRKAIEDSARQHETNPCSQNMLGIILRERGDFEGADKAFRRAIIQAGNSLPVAHYNLALLLEHTENSRDAVSEYRTYLKLSPQGKNAMAARQRLKRLTGA